MAHYSQDEAVPRIRRSGIEDWLGIDRVNRTVHRLSLLRKPGRYLFIVNTASHTFPLTPKQVRLKRNELQESTRNGKQQGSSYNNFSLVTLFEDEERELTSVEEYLAQENISKAEVTRNAVIFLRELSLQGNPADLSTWSNYTGFGFNDVVAKVKVPQKLKSLFSATVRKHNWFIDEHQGIVKLIPLPVASIDEIKRSLDKIFVAMTLSRYAANGVIVPSIMRAILIYSWLIATLFLITYGTIQGWTDYPLWSKSYFEAIVFVSVSVPALIQYASDEPEIIKNAFKANRTLVRNSQVRNYFNLNRFDYAVMGLENTEMWLVSNQTSSFLMRGGHNALKGDICVTDTDSLECVGFYIGTSMARREWEDSNLRVANNSDGSVSILREEAKVPWAISHDYNRLVR